MIIKIAAFQMSVEWGKERSNIDKVIKAIDRLSDEQVHIISFPELFTTGFDYDYIKDRDPDVTWGILDELGVKAKERQAYILAGTLPETDMGRVYNTLFVIGPSGERTAAYRKMHLFPLIDEDRFFNAGEDILVFQTEWARIGLAICYDLRFSDQFRSMALEGAEVIFVPAQFPSSRIDHWDTLLKARAIENQVFIAGINRTGQDRVGSFSGHTAIYDPMGRMIAGGSEGEGWIAGSIDLGEIDRVRRELPALFY
ncbi:carbon-nitrogen family hydrolase [bacterium]|nr:carbon-nitrogen family hydrolase [bacterium]